MGAKFAYVTSGETVLVLDAPYIKNIDQCNYVDFGLYIYEDKYILGCAEVNNTSHLFSDMMFEVLQKHPDVKLSKEFIVKEIVNPFYLKLLEYNLISKNDLLSNTFYIIDHGTIYQVLANFYVLELHEFCSSGEHETLIFSSLAELYNSEFNQETLQNELIDLLSEKMTKSIFNYVIIDSIHFTPRLKVLHK